MAFKNRTALRHKRIRKRVSGSPERPRLSVHFSGRHIYAQVIDDTKSVTLAWASTRDKELAGESSKLRANVETAEKIGKLLAERSVGKDIRRVVFDRGGFAYHGRVKALADAARAGGLEF